MRPGMGSTFLTRKSATELAGSGPPAFKSAGVPRLPRRRYADFLPDLEAIAEREHSPYARHLAVLTALFVAAALLWSALAEVEQVATATGNVRPTGKVKVINHQDAGAVSALYVHEGDQVKAGDRLIEFDPRQIDQELARLTNEWQSLSAEIARLEGEVAGKEPVFDRVLATVRPDLVAQQMRQFDEDRRALASRRSADADKIAQARSALGATGKKITQLEQGLKISRQQAQALADLADKGYYPKLRYLSIQRQVADDEGQLAQAREDANRGRAALAQAEGERDQADAEYNAKLLDRLSQARIEQERAYRGMRQQEAKRGSLLITAPVAGIVQNLVVASAGQSVRPDEAIMNIVPIGDTLVIEARVSNRDIGYVSIGQPAVVKVDTYPYVKYGTLEGTVESIAPDASRDEKTGQTYFNVYVRSKKTYLGAVAGEHPVNPGMQTAVDLQIGHRSILAYLTDRFRQKMESALREP